MSKQKALVFAPLPGEVPGGIGSITAILVRELGQSDGVRFRQPVSKTSSRWFNAVRSVTNLMRLARELRYVECEGTVLIFSSDGLSFWEKCAWSVLVRLVRRRVVMVMVAGTFPRFFEALPSPARHAARWLVRGQRFRLAAQSSAWASYYRSIFPATEIRQVTASVDQEFFGADGAPPAQRGVLTLLFVGWIIEGKGILDLLDAVEIVVREPQRPFHLRLVGPVFGREEYWNAEVARRGIRDLTTFAGNVGARDAILHEYRNADIFVFPSHFEGFPVALLEAVAVGLPSVGTRVGGIPDILDHGHGGLLVSPHAPHELSSAIQLLLNDGALRARLGASAASRARQLYTPAACAASYKSLLGVS
jgi:glycosyltransferase involved in cell wall biosynthesis